MQCKLMFTKHYPFYTTKQMPHVMATVTKKCVSLAAIAGFIMVILAIGYLQIFKTGYFFHRSIAIFHYD